MQPTVDVFNPFERFEIESVLKTLPNGRSNCWKGRNREDERVVVLKLYDGMITAEDREHWLRAQYPGTAKWIEVYPEEKSVFCVRDWIEGTTLYDAVERRAHHTPESATRVFFAKICDAISAIHKSGKVHGAIKASNIFIVDGNPVLADPAVAFPESIGNGQTLDVTMGVSGILHYLNPEILQNKPQEKTSDIYSLGCVMYEWLTGVAPFRGDNDVLVCYQHLSAEPVPIRQLRPDISEALANIVTKCLRKHPIERYSDASTIANSLRDGYETDEPLVVELRPEKPSKKASLTRLPSARTAIISAKDLKCAQEIMRQSPGLSADEVRAKILAAQGDPQERARIPVIPFNANQSKALKDLAGPKKPATEVDPAVVQRALAASGRAAATVPIDGEMLQRAISNTAKPAVTTPIDAESLQKAIQGSAAPAAVASPPQTVPEPSPAEDRYKTPFFAVLAYAVLATIVMAVAYFRLK